MAKPPRPSASPSHLLYLLSLLSLLIIHLSTTCVLADSHFEGFEADDEDEALDSADSLQFSNLRSPPVSQSESPPATTKLTPSEPDTATADPTQSGTPDHPPTSPDLSKPSSTGFDYWDEDEFEGLPFLEQHQQQPSEPSKAAEDAVGPQDPSPDPKSTPAASPAKRSYMVEIVCGSFLIMFAINYFTGKRENENIALAWAAKFATKESIFEKNFSLLGVGEGEDSPLLLKEGQNVFKFYASGRRYCQGLLATMELKSRHDLISRIYNLIVPCKDEISFEVYMNDDAMDNVIFAVAKKKAAKGMQKELRDLQRFAGLLPPPGGRKWVAEELSVISESKEVAGDMITEAVLDQVFGEKAFEKFGKGFISMHFSDQHPGGHSKMLLFKFTLPDVNNMADMTRLVSLVPYYIDLVGRYKISPQARSKTEAARAKAAQEAHKELQNARQEALQKRKLERKKMMEEAEAKLGAEALRKKEAKERARQMKKSMPRMKMTRGH
ncbi:uncharacterized protein At5g49945 [Punica granatum]|uniref:Uncharacterized protein At5g49945 n=2 Tax=Punica granatum TaxID=22663 RepID=A0A218X3T3_PUNGR|nr:uncharacterized protein At5g49945 [Punica granatum]OWM79340.1 hypothetical protein CDL15_Pgr003513 [Punica granatum]